jgi:hypothetical protein
LLVAYRWLLPGASPGFNVCNSAQRSNFCNRWNGLSPITS